MSNRAKPDNSEASALEKTKSALNVEKDVSSDVPSKQSALQSEHSTAPPVEPSSAEHTEPAESAEPAKEFGGQKGPEPTRFGDWEKNGRCTDF